MKRRLTAIVEPRPVVLRRTRQKAVHDVGEFVRIDVAEARLEVMVRVRDGDTGLAVPAKVHCGNAVYPANRPFRHLFHSEFNEKTGTWGTDVLWVEHAGYENIEVFYDVVVDGDKESDLHL